MKKNIKKMMKRMVILSFLTTVVVPPLYGFAEEKTTERTIEESNYTLVVENYNDDFSVELKKDSSFDLEKDWNWSYQTAHTVSAFARGPKGYYVRLGDFVYYCDFETQTLIALCNRPDCLHNKETDSKKRSECTAYVAYGSVNDGLQYYDGKLYANASSVYFDKDINADYREKEYLLELAPDGSSREQVDYHIENAYSFAFHHGSLYYISRETDPETLIGTETVKRLGVITVSDTADAIREHSLKGNGLLCSLRNTVVLLCPFHNSFNFSLLLPIQICRHFDVSCLWLLFEKQFVQPPFPVCTDASKRHNSCPSDKGEPWDERIWSE